MTAILTHGIPMRYWNHREDREETVYLSTRRSGKTGLELTGLRRTYHDREARIRQIGRDMQLQTVGISDEMPVERLREAAAEQDNLLGQLRGTEEALEAVAEQLVGLALTDCHGSEEAVRIMDCLCSRQLHQAVRMMELGEEPEDFFDGRGTRSNARGIGPDAGTSGDCSSRPGTDAAI